MFSVTIAIILVMGGIGKLVKQFQAESLQFTAVGGTIAEEAFSSIRTVAAYGTQGRIVETYEKQIKQATILDYRSKCAVGMMIASMMAILNLQYGLAFWQGARFIKDGDLTLSKTLTVLLASMMGGVSIGHIAPHFGSFALAAAATNKIFEVINRVSPIDSESNDGGRLEEVHGEIEFHNIRHIYPSRPGQTILQDLSFKAPAGKTTAIVGPSGSGKSTIVNLIERFYLPMRGEICLDGRNIQDLNLQWLRRQISLVGQEPVLFSTSIHENIEYGLVGTEYENVSKLLAAKIFLYSIDTD